jgi:hypothetical protein
MIVVQDRIRVPASDLPRLRALLENHYLPAAQNRGLVLMDSGISPPLHTADPPCTFWLHWQLADVGAFWAMRAMAGMDPGVTAFWTEVDSFCPGRTREFLQPDGFSTSPLPAPQAIEGFRTRPRGWRETAQLHLRRDLSDSQRQELESALGRIAELPGVLATHLGHNIAVAHGAGHYTWDVRYRDADAAAAAKASAFWTGTLAPLFSLCLEHLDWIALETVDAGARRPDLATGIKRTALFRLMDGVDNRGREDFERHTLEMPAYIPEILNWRLSRVLPPAGSGATPIPWSHVWEQEYASLDDLNGPYMVHPHHWAFVDTFFDFESGRQIVDTRLCHAYCPLAHGVLGAESAPPGHP